MCIQIDTVSMGMLNGFASAPLPGFTPGWGVGARDDGRDAGGWTVCTLSAVRFWMLDGGEPAMGGVRAG